MKKQLEKLMIENPKNTKLVSVYEWFEIISKNRFYNTIAKDWNFCTKQEARNLYSDKWSIYCPAWYSIVWNRNLQDDWKVSERIFDYEGNSLYSNY